MAVDVKRLGRKLSVSMRGKETERKWLGGGGGGGMLLQLIVYVWSEPAAKRKFELTV